MARSSNRGCEPSSPDRDDDAAAGADRYSGSMEAASYGEQVELDAGGAAPAAAASAAVLDRVGGRGAVRRGDRPGVTVGDFGKAFVAAVLIAALNALLPPIVAALRLPFTVALGFVIVLALDALILLLASEIDSSAIHVDSFGWALVAATRDLGGDRRARGDPRRQRQRRVHAARDQRASPGVRAAARGPTRRACCSWRSTASRCRCSSERCATATRRCWRTGCRAGTHRLAEWETDLSSQTGASQAGILLGSNEDIPAFRWVEKETGKVVACSSPADCAAIEARLASGNGLLVHGGASRGNLFSGEADEVILTASKLGAEKRANPGYRAFLANGFNVTRLLVLFIWEVILERVAAIRQKRRDVRPRGEPRRPLPVPARRPVRRAPRPDRVRRPDGHDARATRGVRDVLELRRGRAPLRARARRHARGASQARPAVRADRAGATVRAPPVQAGGALRPRADPGRDLQAAQRLRPARARRALARADRASSRCRRRGERRRGRPRGRGGDGPQSRRRRPTSSAIATPSCSHRATSASST